jgi:hypothetical protein
MSSHISIWLEDAVRQDLEAEARSRGVRLSTLLTQLATEAARQARRRRIREQSEAVGRYVASSPEAAEFCEFWGTPMAEGLGKAAKIFSSTKVSSSKE